MQKKIIRIMITGKNTELLRKLDQKVHRILPGQIQVRKAMSIQSAEDVIKQGKTDIFIIGNEVSDGMGEDLLQLIVDLYPEHPIIFHSEKEDIQYEWSLYNRFDNIKCVTRSRIFDELQLPLLKAHKKIEKYNRRRLVFSNTTEALDELCYVKPIDNGMLEYVFYDWETKKFHSAYKKTTIAKFLKEQNGEGDIIRCHGSYAVNQRMIKRVNRTDKCLVLEIEDTEGYPMEIPIGAAYYPQVLAQTKGLY